jgi:thiosulfate/3-mercaptopyruvate sulfurtransferase
MKNMLLFAVLFLVAALAIPFGGAVKAFRTAPAATTPPGAQAQPEAPPPVPNSAILMPEELARILQTRGIEKPLILQIGVHLLYKEAHIPGAEYIGAASKQEGIEQLRKRVAGLPHNKFIVLYCGCCPWFRCPNVKPAYEALKSLGFTRVQVLRIDQNFGTNWVQKGYPTAKGG